MNDHVVYQEIRPSEHLNNYIHSFWRHDNATSDPEFMMISPDSFYKIVILVQDGKIINYFMTGIWMEVKEFIVPSNSTTYGVRLKILAPEFLLKQEVASILNSVRQLDLGFLNAKDFNYNDFKLLVNQWETALNNINPIKNIQANKLRLSEYLYANHGDVTATEVSKQIFWTNRQINRYLNKQIGISLKKYLNVQKIYKSYIQIREGRFFPENGYFDQAHFIREIKKHTNETPSNLYVKQNDRFIQLKHIK